VGIRDFLDLYKIPVSQVTGIFLCNIPLLLIMAYSSELAGEGENIIIYGRN